ncbi:hypothetical protein ABBQ32_007350 [Trebouxia sp. C0010 RCD-2024]
MASIPQSAKQPEEAVIGCTKLSVRGFVIDNKAFKAYQGDCAEHCQIVSKSKSAPKLQLLSCGGTLQGSNSHELTVYSIRVLPLAGVFGTPPRLQHTHGQVY